MVSFLFSFARSGRQTTRTASYCQTWLPKSASGFGPSLQEKGAPTRAPLLRPLRQGTTEQHRPAPRLAGRSGQALLLWYMSLYGPGSQFLRKQKPDARASFQTIFARLLFLGYSHSSNL